MRFSDFSACRSAWVTPLGRHLGRMVRQRPAHGCHRLTAQVGADEAMLLAGVYGLRRLTKNQTPPGESPHPAGPGSVAPGASCPPPLAPPAYRGLRRRGLLILPTSPSVQRVCVDPAPPRCRCRSDLLRQLQCLPPLLLRVPFSHSESLLTGFILSSPLCFLELNFWDSSPGAAYPFQSTLPLRGATRLSKKPLCTLAKGLL